MKRTTQHWYFTTDELGRFHSFDWEPAIVENSYEEIEKIWEEEIVRTIDWYKAWYTNGVIDRVERNSWEIFTYTNWELDDSCNN